MKKVRFQRIKKQLFSEFIRVSYVLAAILNMKLNASIMTKPMAVKVIKHVYPSAYPLTNSSFTC